jgi:hypothetical protein
MAFVRQVHPSIGVVTSKTRPRRGLLIAAGVLAALCCTAAFLFFVARDHGHTNVMINEQSAPATARLPLHPQSPAQQAAAPQKALGPQQVPSPSTLGPKNSPAPVTPASNSFKIARAGGITYLGPVRLRLLRTDPVKNTFDVSVILGRRSFSHKRLKLNQPLWIAVNRGASEVQMVVTGIDKNAVTGYWTQSSRPPQLNTQSHPKRRGAF